MSCPDDEFVINNPARIKIFIATVAAVLTDPSALRFEYRKPNDETTTLLTYGVDGAVVKETTGIYHVDLPNDVGGTWKWHWESDGVEAADQGSYRVQAKNV